jgi:hypothetical protein
MAHETRTVEVDVLDPTIEKIMASLMNKKDYELLDIIENLLMEMSEAEVEAHWLNNVN